MLQGESPCDMRLSIGFPAWIIYDGIGSSKHALLRKKKPLLADVIMSGQEPAMRFTFLRQFCVSIKTSITLDAIS